MNTSELWWNRLINSVRFLDDVKDILMDGKSAVMNFSGDIPWLDTMLYTLEQKLSFMTDTRSFEVHDASAAGCEPEKYLFERFCSEAERKKYWPNTYKTYARFLALNENTTLHRRIVCVVGINSDNALAWQKAVTEYLENRKSEDRGVFILIVQGMNIPESKLIGEVKYDDYISDYDCLMLCLTMLSAEKCSSLKKQYVSEIASNIAGNNIETAGILAQAGLSLAKDPFGTAGDIFRENDISADRLDDLVQKSVWEAQIKLVFPRLEDFRRELVQKYQDKIQKVLPITSTSGERVDKAADVEIGQLTFICNKEKFIEKSEFDMLNKMKNARNLLAHRDILTYNRLMELNIF
ncbi:MAG: hypothetical protein IJ666_07965 [Ruminococcus sp.]|nr:hypothetical protein [Ruminococcus sp.]